MRHAKLAVIGLITAGVAFSACSGTPVSGPPSSGIPAAVDSQQNSVQYATVRNAGTQGSKQMPIKQLMVGSNSCCSIAVDPKLNHIYVSSGGNLSGNHTTVVNGSLFSIMTTINGFGGANNVDSKTHNLWLPGLYGGDVGVYSGVTESQLATVSLGGCPDSSVVDSARRYAWVAAQCGGGNDPVFAVNADTNAIVAGPIGTGGVMGPITLNPVNGKLYVLNSAGTFEINPTTFALSATSFGVVLGGDNLTRLLYARVASGLNIVNAVSEKVVGTVSLTYAPAYIGVNPYLNHIYVSPGNNTVEVREGNNGNLLQTITLPAGVTVLTLGANTQNSQIYATGIAGGTFYLYEIKDTY